MHRFTRLTLFVLLIPGLLIALAPRDAAAQTEPRFGLGFNGLLSSIDGLGLGFRGRVAVPMNQDLSFAIDLGLTGFILGGRDDATYVFDPQVSAIVTLPGRSARAPYILGGLGAYIPFSDKDKDEGGPTLHGGVGWVRTLNETTLFYEIDPALVIGKEAVDVIFPFRIGIIF